MTGRLTVSVKTVEMVEAAGTRVEVRPPAALEPLTPRSGSVVETGMTAVPIIVVLVATLVLPLPSPITDNVVCGCFDTSEESAAPAELKMLEMMPVFELPAGPEAVAVAVAWLATDEAELATD